ncbi:bifunctional transcriptional activator/DNA repair enzyme protein Ada [Massilia psychrophila]|uniref:methylated-DNA--[protein]-cysteine S-methyltransferase n=2 Tax=Massilia psychrophila TaxID=1603353 RepID=A0A2G8T717_9BURK|nr:bifunctional transcriptional activator/DNA repair enzyme protein Ada [Massilia psychrophila]GGE61143.1 bifunctional transcriptional activator/DNA repair enzyme protein Ada [Massilia psychrophila]
MHTKTLAAAAETMTVKGEFSAGYGYGTDAERWDALQRRDAGADGVFWYSVSSTGVYCRPSCGARAALRRNVRFHDSCVDAEQAGFRACLRCKPKLAPLAERHAQAVAQVCRLIDAAAETPDLDALAQACAMSRFHFQRVVKSHTGITPTAFRGGGSGCAIRFAIGACSLGAILVAATDKGICAILMGDDPDLLARDLQDRFPRAELRGADADFEATVAKVVGLVEAPAIGLDLPLDVRGTVFQQRVWQALRAIPSGATVSYAELAARIGVAAGARAVAGACAANPIAVAIPCHRVVRQDGALSGYRWGVERKAALLKREGGA